MSLDGQGHRHNHNPGLEAQTRQYWIASRVWRRLKVGEDEAVQLGRVYQVIDCMRGLVMWGERRKNYRFTIKANQLLDLVIAGRRTLPKHARPSAKPAAIADLAAFREQKLFEAIMAMEAPIPATAIQVPHHGAELQAVG